MPPPLAVLAKPAGPGVHFRREGSSLDRKKGPMRKLLRINSQVKFAAAALILVMLAAAVPACSRGPLRFAWLSDTHVGSDRGADDLRAAVADINAAKGLNFILVTGDVTEMGSFDELRLAKDILDGLRVRYYIIPGNHDTKWSESGATDFPRLWGSDRFVFAKGLVRFIGMHQGPVMKMGDGHWAPQDVRWLDKLLAEKG